MESAPKEIIEESREKQKLLHEKMDALKSNIENFK
jgi:hypothetical protein